jgi:S-adenosylmethionine:tRNA ribosyltransferase-isomerase
LAEGERAVSLESGRDFESFVDRYGRMPVPPYILSARKSRLKRALYSASDVEPDWDEIEGESQRELLLDRERYQTIFARRPGSVAAPTAGLHFTESLMDALRIKRIEIRYVTLHVGPGTFAPVKTDDPTQHPMHRERFSIEETNARAIESARRDPDRRIVAVGTTVVRVLETLVRDHGAIRPGAGATDLLILPGFAFRAIDALITNFHLPRSTLLMLVSAWAGRERILSAYEEAIRMGYRFYSYGDAMLIE